MLLPSLTGNALASSATSYVKGAGMHLIANSLLITILTYGLFLASIAGAGAFTILACIEIFYHIKYKLKKDFLVNMHLIERQMLGFSAIAVVCWSVAIILDRIIS